MNEKIKTVLTTIETMNKQWSLELDPEQANRHSYGRIRTQNNEVKLWAVPRTTGQLLKFFVTAIKAKIVLELGCSAGYSTLWLAMGAMITNGHIYTTEIFDEKVKLAKENFIASDLDKYITVYQQDIIETLTNWQHGKIDFLFMDADIPRYPEYLDKIIPILSQNGIIIIDNAVTHENYLSPFYEKIDKLGLFNREVLAIDHGLCLINRI